MTGALADQAVERASAGSVVLRVADGIARVTLNRPEKFNAIGSAVLAGLRAAVDHATRTTAVRVVVLHGAGRGFSAGGDLDEVSALVTDAARLDAFLDLWRETLAVLESCPLPTVAAVHGAALAGGLELVQACDVVVAGDATVLGDQHANYGLFPAGGSTQRLPRLLPPRHALWLLLSGETIDPKTAQRLGLVTRVVAEANVLDEALAMAALLVTKSATNSAAIKQAVHRGAGLALDAALDAERGLAIAQQTSPDAQAGFAAFRARATPVFADRT